MALTGKKRAFADAVLAGLSNKDAAIAAGYSAATASAAGSRLVKDADVARYLAEARKTAKAAKSTARSTKEPAPAPERPAFDLGALLMHSDPKSFLLAAMNDANVDPKQRIEAAKALMPFMHQKKGESGKKEQQQEAAKKVAGRFAAAAAPRLAAAGGKKV